MCPFDHEPAKAEILIHHPRSPKGSEIRCPSRPPSFNYGCSSNPGLSQMLLVEPDYTISANPVVASRKEGGKGGEFCAVNLGLWPAAERGTVAAPFVKEMLLSVFYPDMSPSGADIFGFRRECDQINPDPVTERILCVPWLRIPISQTKDSEETEGQRT